MRNYEEGFQDGIKHAQKWNKVENRFPPRGIRVLVRDISNIVSVGVWEYAINREGNTINYWEVPGEYPTIIKEWREIEI